MEAVALTKSEIPSGIDYIKYKTKGRDISRFIRRSIRRNTGIIEKSYEGKIHPLTLKGSQAKEYMRAVIQLFEKVVDDSVLSEIFLNEQIKVISKFLKNFKILFRIKNNMQVRSLDGNKLSFDELLTLDINEKTGFPFYGEIEGMIDYIKDCREFGKDDVKKVFEDFIKTKNKLNKSDYLKLLALSNRKAMSEIDIEKLQYMEEVNTKVNKNISKITINHQKYNYNTGFELINIDIWSNKLIGRKGLMDKVMRKKIPILKDGRNKDTGLYLDRPFDELLKNTIINDPDFISEQIAELLLKEYNLPKFDSFLGIVSVGIKTPYNTINTEFFPEFDLGYSKEDYFLIIRRQNSKSGEAIYAIVK